MEASENPPAGGETPAKAAAIVPPPLGDVEMDPARNRVAVNIRRELARQLGEGGATVLDASFRVQAGGGAPGLTYQPDVIVDAGRVDDGARLARQPKVIFEVAAAGTERAAFIETGRIHEKLGTVDVHVLVDPERPAVVLRRRTAAGGWEEETLTEAGETIYLPTIRCALLLKSIYE